MKILKVHMLVMMVAIAQAKVVTYDPAPEIIQSPNAFTVQSDQYQVEVVQQGETTEVFVWMNYPQQYTNNCKTTSWAQFDFEGQVTVRVTKLNGEVNDCTVLPGSKQIEIRQFGRTVEFDIDRPCQLAVDFQKGIYIDHPMLIFADPIQEVIPSPDDPDVIYFSPGMHVLDEKLQIPSGKTVYLAGGAFVKGLISSRDTENIKIMGRGILSGESYAVRTGGHMIAMHANNLFIEGITIIHAPQWCVRLDGRNHLVRNIKAIGWHFSTDGVQTGTNGIVEDCFFKVNDDAIKLYNDNTMARRCVIWQMENGAPLQIGWSQSKDVRNFYAYDIDVIRIEHEWDNENLSVFCAIHGGRGHMRNYVYEDIRIENAPWRIFHIVTKPNRWAAWDPERGNLSDLTFRNIDFWGEQRVPSLIMGHDAKHKIRNITFENLTINGKKIMDAESGHIIIDDETVENVIFK